MPAPGAPERVAVPLLLFTKPTPVGSAPVSEISIEAPEGEPVVFTVKVPAEPTVNAAALALVIAGGEVVVKLVVALAASPWPASTSVMPAASAVATQVVALGSTSVGVSTKLAEGDAESENARADPLGHSRVNEDSVAFTLSLKLNVTALLVATAVAPFTGAVEVTVGSVLVVKLSTKFAAGLRPALSVICAATTVTRHAVAAGSAESGVSTRLAAGEAESANARAFPTGHSIANELVVAFTGSEKLTVRVLAVETLPAPFTGIVVVIVGRASTLMLMVRFAVCGPPAPVLPWSSMSMRRVAAPVKPVDEVNDMPVSAVLRLASGPVATTSAVPLPVTVRPAVPESVAVPLVTVRLTFSAALFPSTSATLTVPGNARGESVATSAVAGAVTVGALFCAAIVTVASAVALSAMPSFTTTDTVRVVPVGFGVVLL